MISRKLKKWREAQKLTQVAAAKQLGVPAKTYIDWEQGRRIPRGLAYDELLERISR